VCGVCVCVCVCVYITPTLSKKPRPSSQPIDRWAYECGNVRFRNSCREFAYLRRTFAFFFPAERALSLLTNATPRALRAFGLLARSASSSRKPRVSPARGELLAHSASYSLSPRVTHFDTRVTRESP